MTSQAQGFVHLLAVSSEHTHEPQIFRMRWTQPLDRLASAYASFRELGPNGAKQLKMTHATHGELDQTETATTYSFTDGEQVVFTELDASAAATPAQASAPKASQRAASQRTAAAAASQDVSKDSKKAMPPPSQPHRSEQASQQASIPANQGSPVKASQASQRATAASQRAAASQALVPSQPANAGVVQSESKASSQQETKAVKRALDEDKPRRGRGRARGERSGATGRGRGRKAAAAAAAAAMAEDAAAEAAAEAAEVAAAAAPEKPSGTQAETLDARPAAAPKAKAKAKAKAKPEGKAKGKQTLASSLRARALKSVSQKAAEGTTLFGAPTVQRSLLKNEVATVGPAKGWKLYAWLHERKGKPKMVKWRAISPERTRAFEKFNVLKDSVSEGIWTQIYISMRPRLKRRITSRRSELEKAHPEAQTACKDLVPIAAPPPPAKKPRALKQIADRPALKQIADRPEPKTPAAKAIEDLKTPPKRGATMRQMSRASTTSQSMLATQAAKPLQLKLDEPSKAWNCKCIAHLRRHPRCSPSGDLQPELVHICKESMVVGRLNTCDIVMDASTPQMISRRHAVLTLSDGICTLIDQKALNGLLVNGAPMQGERPLRHGDTVTFGVDMPIPELDYVFEERPADSVRLSQVGA